MLTKFEFVDTEGLTGVHYKGRKIPFEKIDDTLAEQLISKTHVLKRLAVAEPATAPVVLTLAAPAAEQLAALPADTTSGKKKDE